MSVAPTRERIAALLYRCGKAIELEKSKDAAMNNRNVNCLTEQNNDTFPVPAAAEKVAIATKIEGRKANTRVST